MSEELGEVVAGDPLEEADEDKADSKVQPFIDPDMDLCPVVPLGFTGSRVIFAMPEGEIRNEIASKIGQMIRTDIFACAAGQAFLTNWRDREGKFLRDFCAMWFVRRCRQAGYWDSGRPMRELGVWPDGEDRIVLHLGDRIWRYPKKGKLEDLTIRQALGEKGGALYRLRAAAPRPMKAVKIADTGWVRTWLDNWRFEAIGDEGLTGADVVAGWLMASLLGGFAPFRGHLLLHALAGSGKTELMQFAQAALSALAGEVIDSFSEAGLKNELAGNARPVLIDEAESGDDARGPGVVERALELLRRMATGKGANRVQGDVGGGTVTQTAVGSAMLAGISPPKLGAADASRFVEIRLLPLSGAIVSKRELEKAKAKARELAPSLLGRALKGAWRYRDDVDLLTEAIVKLGETPRSADLVAMLIAGRRLLLADDPLTPDEAAEEVRLWRPLLAQRAEADAVRNDGLDALQHLLAADAGVHRHDRRETVGRLLHRCVTGDSEYHDALMALGIRVERGEMPSGRPGPYMMVANGHPKLEALFKTTKWPDYRRTLAMLDTLGPEYATCPTTNSIRYLFGPKKRALCIPLAPLFEAYPSSGAAAKPGKSSESVPADVPQSVPDEVPEWPEENE